MRRQRRWAVAVALFVLTLGVSTAVIEVSRVPSVLHLSVGVLGGHDLALPPSVVARHPGGDVVAVEAGETAGGWLSRTTVSLHALTPGDSRITLFAFNLVPVRTVAVRVRSPLEVAVGGHAIGVILDDEGLRVTGFRAVAAGRGELPSPAEAGGMRVGDFVRSIDGQSVLDEAQLTLAAELAGSERTGVLVSVNREGSGLELWIVPRWCERLARYTLGLEVKGGTAGVGTLSFFDPGSGRYIALGHPVAEAPTGSVRGRIVRALVSGVQHGRRGQPGEKIGVFIEPGQQLGSVESNSAFGIVGQLDRDPGATTRMMTVATISEARLGPAEVRTVIDGQRVESFEVQIIRLNRQSAPADRGMVLKVVDEHLVRRTGGIIQGMSGSPIVQDGRLIGVITHVFVNDPTRGYGVYAEWMAYACGLLDVYSSDAA